MIGERASLVERGRVRAGRGRAQLVYRKAASEWGGSRMEERMGLQSEELLSV